MNPLKIILAVSMCVSVAALSVVLALRYKTRALQGSLVKSDVAERATSDAERASTLEKPHVPGEEGETMKTPDVRRAAVETPGAGPGTPTRKPVAEADAPSHDGADAVHAAAPEFPSERIVEDAPASLVDAYRGQPNAILRREALRQWADEDRPGLLAVAELALNDPNPTVILQALDILGRLGERSSMPVLVQVFKDNYIRDDGYDLPIREAAIRAMGHCGDASLVPMLLEELAKREDFSYNNVIVESLGRIGDPSALEAIEHHLLELESTEPTESIAMAAWRESLRIAVEARDRIKDQ